MELKQLDYNNQQEQQNILMQIWSKTGLFKAPSVCKHIEKLLDDNKKLLIFAHHLDVMNLIEIFLNKKVNNFYLKKY